MQLIPEDELGWLSRLSNLSTFQSLRCSKKVPMILGQPMNTCHLRVAVMISSQDQAIVSRCSQRCAYKYSLIRPDNACVSCSSTTREF